MTFLTCKFLKKNSILSLFHNDPNNCCSCKIHFQLKLLYPSEKIILMGCSTSKVSKHELIVLRV